MTYSTPPRDILDNSAISAAGEHLARRIAYVNNRLRTAGIDFPVYTTLSETRCGDRVIHRKSLGWATFRGNYALCVLHTIGAPPQTVPLEHSAFSVRSILLTYFAPEKLLPAMLAECKKRGTKYAGAIPELEALMAELSPPTGRGNA